MKFYGKYPGNNGVAAKLVFHAKALLAVSPIRVKASPPSPPLYIQTTNHYLLTVLALAG